MASKRKTGNDYLKEFNELNAKTNSVVIKIRSRVLELAKIYPDAVVEYRGGIPIPAISLTSACMQHWMDVETACTYIIKIEEYAEEQSGHVQTKMF